MNLGSTHNQMYVKHSIQMQMNFPKNTLKVLICFIYSTCNNTNTDEGLLMAVHVNPVHIRIYLMTVHVNPPTQASI
jgi:hypothetical protein